SWRGTSHRGVFPSSIGLSGETSLSLVLLGLVLRRIVLCFRLRPTRRMRTEWVLPSLGFHPTKRLASSYALFTGPSRSITYSSRAPGLTENQRIGSGTRSRLTGAPSASLKTSQEHCLEVEAPRGSLSRVSMS